MNKVHFFLQAKGGIGKSFSALLFSQYLMQKGKTVVGNDTDQNNQTLMQYKGLNVKHVNIMGENRTFNTRQFDGMVESMLDATDTEFVIDNGANTFEPLCNYMIEGAVFQMLRDAGHEVVIHTIIGGGDNFLDTLAGFADLARQFDTPIVVWKNRHFGKTEDKGVELEETKAFKAAKNKILGVVTLPALNPSTHGADIQRMCKERMTLKEALAAPDFGRMAQSRVKRVFDEVYAQLDELETASV